MPNLAPIALFTFKRPEHTRQALESLAANPEFLDSPLFIFCDGARNDTEAITVRATRKLVRDWPHPIKTIVERDRNLGLANSVIAGVTELCERFGKIIVVEDDLVVSPVFLNYLNAALDHYVDDSIVMQVSAHMFPVEMDYPNDAVMLPFTTSWGWATWARAWKHFDPSLAGFDKLRENRELRRKFNLDGSYPYFRMLKRQIKGRIDSWAIRWYVSVFFSGGLTLYPCHSLVRNAGYGENATHTMRNNRREVREIWTKKINKFPISRVDNDAKLKVFKFLAYETSKLRWIVCRLNLHRIKLTRNA